MSNLDTDRKDMVRGENLGKLTDRQLTAAHFYSHTAWRKFQEKKKWGDWSRDQILLYHGRVIAEMRKRGQKHNPQNRFDKLAMDLLGSEQRKLPKIELVSPHGRQVASGLKTGVVRTRSLPGDEDRPHFLVERGKVLGVIRFGEGRDINLAEFEKLRSQHRITDKTRAKWWPKAEVFKFYPVVVEKVFLPPQKMKVTKPPKKDKKKRGQSFAGPVPNEMMDKPLVDWRNRVPIEAEHPDIMVRVAKNEWKNWVPVLRVKAGSVVLSEHPYESRIGSSIWFVIDDALKYRAEIVKIEDVDGGTVVGFGKPRAVKKDHGKIAPFSDFLYLDPIYYSKKDAGDLATVNHGEQENYGSIVKLKDIVDDFKGAQLVNPLVCLVGGVVTQGETEGDIDVLIKLPVDTPERIKKPLEFRIYRQFPKKMWPRFHFLYDELGGPFTSYVPLADLAFTARDEMNVVQMSVDEADAETNDETAKQIEQTAEEDASIDEMTAEIIKGKSEGLAQDDVLKQADPYMEIPSEDKTHRYSVQHHYRGKSVHADLRMQGKARRSLTGWTINDALAGKIKEPVETLAAAKAADRGDNFKVNWKNGTVLKRKTPSGALVNINLLSETKPRIPNEWLDLEGVIPIGDPEKPGPGATKNFPGVFSIVDRGEVEFGAQKPWLHEYFFDGNGLKRRVIFRLLQSRRKDIEEEYDEQAIVDWILARLAEGVMLPVAGGSELVEVEKRIILRPPHSYTEGGKPRREALTWQVIFPKEQEPYVLSNEAEKKGWLPPKGYSALPRYLRKQVPTELRYWTKNRAEALKLRAELRKKMKDVLDVKPPIEKTVDGQELEQ